MTATSLATAWQLYWAGLALGSLGVCGAALLAVRLLRKRSAPLRHGLLLTALCVTALSPAFLAALLMLGRGWQLDVVRIWRSDHVTTGPFYRPTTDFISRDDSPLAAGPAPADHGPTPVLLADVRRDESSSSAAPSLAARAMSRLTDI